MHKETSFYKFITIWDFTKMLYIDFPPFFAIFFTNQCNWIFSITAIQLQLQLQVLWML